ncbi:MAG: YggS family pyridoxal phosphate-dependent enzyme [Lachnospiraceae bacterium]|nr:YggS family pyridoxal phosphate-dependent enzyme [Lachnospiraceae bacterium]
MIKDNILDVQNNIKEALKRSKVSNSCTLIAVSKTKPVSMLQEAYDTGIRDFGENKVQEILEKYEVLPNDIKWHMIGHLQTNKVKYIIDKVCAIHSVDSFKLAEVISKEAVKHNITMPVFIEVNIGDEESKFGISKNDVNTFYDSIKNLPNLKIEGLMCVAPYVDTPEDNRQHFVDLRNISVDISNKNVDNIYGNKLSMGMSNDYIIAVEEGSSYVRVGTDIFGNRNYNV